MCFSFISYRGRVLFLKTVFKGHKVLSDYYLKKTVTGSYYKCCLVIAYVL